MQDPYKALGVAKTASQDDVKKAYRKLAKRYHPDLTKGNKKGEARFKDISEAYAVLGDPDKRKDFDAKGAASSAYRGTGQDWDNVFGRMKTGGGDGRSTDDDISEFMKILRGFGGGGDPKVKAKRDGKTAHLEAEMSIDLDESVNGCKKRVTLKVRERGVLGKTKTTEKTLDIKIPKGIRDGQKIRLKAPGGGEDVYIRITVRGHRHFKEVDGQLVGDLKIAPWEAALGAKVRVPTLDGSVELKIPPGVNSGQKLRLRGKGAANKKGDNGDLHYRIQICVPKELSAVEKTLFEKLRDNSSFRPRG